MSPTDFVTKVQTIFETSQGWQPSEPSKVSPVLEGFNSVQDGGLVEVCTP